MVSMKIDDLIYVTEIDEKILPRAARVESKARSVGGGGVEGKDF